MLTKEEYEIYKQKKYVIVLDTNIFTHLYKYSPKISSEMLDVLKINKNRLWIPNQVYKEFKKNYQKSRGDQEKKYRNIGTKYHSILNETKNNFKQVTGEYQRDYFTDIENLYKDLESLLTNMKCSVDKYLDNHLEDRKKHENFLKNDDVNNFIEQLKNDGLIGKKFSIKETIEILKEGDIRFKNLLPPGFKDCNKPENKYGDLFIWKEILKYTNENKNNIIFITDDTKEDWWEKKGEEVIDLRKELKEEFEENCPNLDIRFLTMEEFYRFEIDNLSNNAKLFLGYHSYLTKLKNEGKLSIIDNYLSDNKNRFIEQSGMDIFCKDNDINLSDVSTIINNIEWDIGGTFLAVENNESAFINIFLTGKINFDIKYSFSYQTQVDSFLVGSADAYIKIVDNELSNDYTINNVGFTVSQYSYRDGLMTTLKKILNNENDFEDYGNFFNDVEHEDNGDDKNSL